MRITLSLLSMLLVLSGFANRVGDALKAKQSKFETTQVQSLKPAKMLPSLSQIDQAFSDISFLEADNSSLVSIQNSQPEIISFPKGTFANLQDGITAFKVNVFTEDAVIRLNSGRILKPKDAVFYRGQLDSDPNSLVSIAIQNGEIAMVVSSSDGEYNLAKTEGNIYALYSFDGLENQNKNFCGTADKPIENMERYIRSGHRNTGHEDKLVRVYFEIAHTIFDAKGGTTGAVNYLTAVFSQVQTLYANEGINVAISEVFVWDTSSPYDSSGSSSTILNNFRSNRSSFNGDIAHVLNLQDNLGGVAYVDVLCVKSYAYAFSGIRTNYSNVPNYSWTVEVITHEMGHNLGSPHTQSCSWPSGALDDCYPTEGSCPRGPTPTNGGTIMSYCHLTSTGINFNNGFGAEPGDLIRGKVGSASCLQEVQTCRAVSNLTAENVTDVSFDLTYTGGLSSSTNRIFLNGSYYGDGGIGSASITGLSPATSYTIEVQTVCDDGTVKNSGSINVVTLTDAPAPDYCAANGNDDSYEHIAGVSVDGQNITSGRDNGYADRTSTVFDIDAETSIPVSLTPGFSSGSYNEVWRVWIDYNRDGDFADNGELVVSGSGSSTVTGSFTAPARSDVLETRMRVIMRYNNAPSACGSFDYGEVEDYKVRISPKVVLPCDAVTNLSASSIGQNGFRVDYNGGSSDNTYQVLLNGVNSGSAGVSSVTLSGLSSSTDYEVVIRTLCPDGQVSDSEPISVRTQDVPCNAVSGLSASSITRDAFVLSYSGGVSDHSYTLILDGAQSGSAGQSSTSVSGLDAGTTYQVAVQTNCSAGGTELSASISVTTEEIPCDAVTNLQASSIGTTSFSLSYSGGTSDNGYTLLINGVASGSAGQSSTNVSGLAPGTTYQVAIRTDCAAGGNLTSNAISVTTNDEPVNVNYCASRGNNSSYFWIAAFGLNGANYTSGNNGGYGDFSTFQVPLNGGSNSISLDPDYSLFSYRVYWSVWIDLNKDGDFTDANELVFRSSGTNTRTGSFSVPNVNLNTRMRIQMKYGSYSNSCETFSYGEVEDVEVVIGAGSAIASNFPASVASFIPTIGISPNPVLKGQTITIPQLMDGPEGTVKVYDISGRLVDTKYLPANQSLTELSTSNYSSGTYILEVQNGELVHKQKVIIR